MLPARISGDADTFARDIARLTSRQKAKALVDGGLADNMADAYAMLEDMGA